MLSVNLTVTHIFKVNYNITRFFFCSKSIIKTPEQYHAADLAPLIRSPAYRSGVFILDIEHELTIATVRFNLA